jgi:hypothetical protein
MFAEQAQAVAHHMRDAGLACAAFISQDTNQLLHTKPLLQLACMLTALDYSPKLEFKGENGAFQDFDLLKSRSCSVAG